MKRTALYFVILLVAALLPVHRTDVGKLRPVEVVSIYKEEDLLIIKTDTGDSGIGKTAADAYRNLEKPTAGVIFLDTANYLLVDDTAKNEIVPMSQWLKPNIRICFAARGIDLSAAARYLTEHQPKVKLKEYGSGAVVETLIVINGRMDLKKLEKMKKVLDKERNICYYT